MAMNIRQPVRAGSFYEESAPTCRHQATKLLDQATLPKGLSVKALRGGLVPHAGWSFSGRLAAMTFKALVAAGPVETFVLFGADHFGVVRQGEVFDSGVWLTPLGEALVDADLAAGLIADSGGLLRSNPDAHLHEHSLEVQIPLLQVLCPLSQIVPIAVPPTAQAVEIGRAVGESLARREANVRIVGSTDLTHHGGHFPAPGGHGAQGEKWTRGNDRRILDLIESMSADKVLLEAQEHGNACGAGAIAATIAACQALGAARGLTLQYTNSYQVMHELYPDDPDDTTVGYASVVFG